VLASRCCRLPLALRVAAELASARPAVPLAELAGELAGRQRRLDLLDAGGDPRSAVRTVFSWSYQHLDTAAARAFRLLGLHPGPDVDPYAATALTCTTPEGAGQLLDQLARAHLIQLAWPDRYGMHDLLRAYAGELAVAQGAEEEQRAALTRLFDYYLHTAAGAMDALHPAERHRRPRIPAPATPAPPLASSAAARVWLDTERANLVAVAAHTAEHGWPGYTTRLALALFRYLDIGGYFAEAATVQGHALRAARRAGDHAAEATALTSLGAVDMRQGRYHEAAGRYQQAVTLFRKTGDRADQARAIGNLGAIDLQQGRYQQATGHLQQVLTLCRETGDRTGEAEALNSLGEVFLATGQPSLASARHGAALGLADQIADEYEQARAHDGLARVYHATGDPGQARRHWREALALYAALGTPEVEQVRAQLIATGEDTYPEHH
jgi:tetratricopeptide (TPR) repeat protein